jgi:anti-anti-sigma regulatory factor
VGKILFAEKDGIHVLKFEGDVRLSLGPTISRFLDRTRNCTDLRALIVDMSEATAIDSTALGLLAKLGIYCREEFSQVPSIISPNPDITRILASMAMEEVYLITDEAVTAADLIELPQEVASEDAMRDQVLEAHKTLMALNEDNRARFRDLVDALEEECEAREPPVARTGCL